MLTTTPATVAAPRPSPPSPVVSPAAKADVLNFLGRRGDGSARPAILQAVKALDRTLPRA